MFITPAALLAHGEEAMKTHEWTEVISFMFIFVIFCRISVSFSLDIHLNTLNEYNFIICVFIFLIVCNGMWLYQMVPYHSK